MTTWKDIKYATLQKMFSITGSQTNIPTDMSTMEYVNAMPQACNEALQLLSTAGKFIIKEFQYANFPYENMLGKDLFKAYSIVNDTLSFAVDGALSFYFQILGHPTSCKLYVGDKEVKNFFPEYELPEAERGDIDYKSFRVMKGNIPYPEWGEDEEPSNNVRLVVEAWTPVTLLNVCFYESPFESDKDVPPYEKYIRIKMNEAVDDFYQLAPAELYDLGVNGSQYIVANRYFQEADKTLVIERSKPGIYIIHYRAYPQQITLETPDDTELTLDPDVAVLIPSYIASELYKDDDVSLAQIYRNEFEVGREALSQSAIVPKREKFVPSSGWA
jgi:hypothetical protein